MSNSREDTFRNIIEGNKRFRGSNREFRKFAEYQDPDYVIISCSDSRVPPSIITDSPLGSLFEIRAAGGMIDYSALASVEFALETLNVKGVLVIGHTKCGAVTEAQKLFTNAPGEKNMAQEGALQHAVNEIFKVISKDPANQNDLDNAVIDNAKAQLEKLMESEIVKEKSDSGKIVFSASLYDIEDGTLILI